MARFGERDVARLLGDAGIVRHRGKIEAAIANARAAVALDVPLAELVWSFAPSAGAARRARSTTCPRHAGVDRPVEGAEARGFRFVGPTTAYAAMQACGLVNDHLAGCWVRAEVESEALSSLGDG